VTDPDSTSNPDPAHLRAASDALATAAEAMADPHAERAREQADALAALADRERGPDHGRLARHENALTELQEATGSDGVAEALAHLRRYREDVPGV
jgi:hypothetical protein